MCETVGADCADLRLWLTQLAASYNADVNSRDTLEEARAVQVQALRAMSGSDRVVLACMMSDDAVRISRAGTDEARRRTKVKK